MLDKYSLIKAECIQGQISHDEGHILSWRESWGRETMSVKRGGIFSSGKNGKKKNASGLIPQRPRTESELLLSFKLSKHIVRHCFIIPLSLLSLNVI